MSYRPAHQEQLGAGVPVPGRTRGSRDCGPRATSTGIDGLTEGEKVPSVQEVRRREGTSGPQTTSIADAKRGVDSYRRVRGRRPLRMLLRWTVAGIEQALEKGRGVQVAIDYGMFNRLMARTGDPNFTGGHSIYVKGRRDRRGIRWWLLWDSLDDGRRAGIPPPRARWVKASSIIQSAESFAGGPGKAQAGVFTGGQKRGR